MCAVSMDLNSVCGICFETIDPGQKVSIHSPIQVSSHLPPIDTGVKHPYHKKCCKNWKKVSPNCPACGERRITWETYETKFNEETRKLNLLKCTPPPVPLLTRIKDVISRGFDSWLELYSSTFATVPPPGIIAYADLATKGLASVGLVVAVKAMREWHHRRP